MADANLIATLVARSSAAERAVMLEYNKKRAKYPSTWSRETTPAQSDVNDGNRGENDNTTSPEEYQLRFYFSQPPKDYGEGYVFGWWTDDCDVQLFDRKQITKAEKESFKTVSKKHFALDFDLMGNVIVRDTSQHGTRVKYGDQEGDKSCNDSTWIMFDGVQGPLILSLDKANIIFEVVLPPRHDDDKEYRANVETLLRWKKSASGSPSDHSAGLTETFDELDLPSTGRTKARFSASVREKLSVQFYTPPEAPLGEGLHGTVYRVLNVSSGESFAGKFFFKDALRAETLDFHRRTRHANVAYFVHAAPLSKPLLVTDFYPEENLADMHGRTPLSLWECKRVLQQVLSALEFFHRTFATAHANLKPSNILVQSRDPPRVRVTDFGMMRDNDDDDRKLLTSFRGNPKYGAPELWQPGPYTTAVDVWSIGVIILEMANESGLPHCDGLSPVRHFAAAEWQRKMVSLAFKTNLKPNSGSLMAVLRDCMIRLPSEARWTADRCENEMQRLRI